MVAALFWAVAARGATEWTAARGDGYEIVTDSGENVAKRISRRVKEMRHLLGGVRAVLPLRVLLLESGEIYRAVRPSGTTAGFYQSSADGDWIAVSWGRPDSERAVSHEMVHAYLEHSGPRRPLWLEEGLAEYYSTAELNGETWTIGRPIASHVRLLNERAWLGEREFFEAGHDSAMRNELSRAGVFYAQSWAIVHYLLTTPGIRERAPEFFAAVLEGEPFAAACERTTGLRPGLLIESARRAAEGGRFRTAVVRAGSPDVGSETVPARMTRPEVESILVALAIAVGRPEAAKSWSPSPAQQGLLALAAGDKEKAERLLRLAAEQGSPDPAVYFELALLERERGGDRNRVGHWLRETVARNPNHAEAQFLLGLRAAAEGDTEGAIGYYQQAARILPRQATFWHALALALAKAGRDAEASHAALRCRQAARNSAERTMAASIAHLQPAASPRPKRSDVTVPESWKGLQGDQKAEGDLVDFRCATSPPEAVVETAIGRLVLRVVRPREIPIRGAGSAQTEFLCGAQRTPVRVEYSGATGELTALEFR